MNILNKIKQCLIIQIFKIILQNFNKILRQHQKLQNKIKIKINSKKKVLKIN